MDSKVFDLQIDDQNYKGIRPNEDYMGFVWNLFVVADGITRDPIGISNFNDASLEELAEAYPNPSPARIAAERFVEKFLEYMGPNINSLEEFKSRFKYSNNSIKELNEKENPNPDYLENDYWACVAAACCIKDDKLFWGVIGDCRIKVFDSNGKLKFDTPNSVDDFEKFFYGPENDRSNFDWSVSESRVLIRKEFRNNPNKKFKGKVVGYGAATGEKNAEKFMYFGELVLSPNDFIVIYSDGFEHTTQHQDFFKQIHHTLSEGDIRELEAWSLELGKQDYNKFGHERSMLLISVY